MSEATLNTIREARAVAILRANDNAIARDALAAAVRGGFRVLEVTLSTPGAIEIIADLARDSRLMVGAGTVLTVDQARAAVRAGARFLVSPVVDPEVVVETNRLGAVSIPGCATPSEMWQAHRAGAPLQKLFPAPSSGPTWLRTVLAPMPFLRVIPTSGVDAENAAEWLAAGAFAVGCVRSLFPPQELAARAWDSIENRARALLAAVLD
ncbi:MAG TPA: bifunctional 4-hydroxy-2-oxoglutarate aldolase/2-dehydro-3-deoxy-phosphogluconate aldolase [Kofleriaceae bacterium]|nr:bifunctional 4-hydroxy-2-oxoglutarate aldolase/2-dehydro-3-deoxy-phosphogluconate aldolase [Kofleriaceae bacterium]HMG56983.1 bifunctional 4-hydroxy-2-oxoglutarate aldolase/2-dehydro-3-deoxy-phosphogluconate aldolase [Kofleriaceae bacterium]